LYIADLYNDNVRKVATNGVISTVVTTPNTGLYSPEGVCLDKGGNLYIADTGNHRILKITTNGVITSVAGYRSGYTGDGGAATSARLNSPWGVVLDDSGALYIADKGNNRIRKVDTNGIITTVAGNGNGGFSGDGGAATNASLFWPACVALDAVGNLYIADWRNHRIREVHFNGLPILTLTNVSANDAGPYAVVITSPYGSVTSAVVTLNVTVPRTPPQIVTNDLSLGFGAYRQFGFNLSGALGQNIVVDGSTNLIDWTALFTNTAGSSPFY